MKRIVIRFAPNFIIEAIRGSPGIGKFAFNKDLDVKRDIQNKYGHNGDLLDLFATNKDYIVHKWHHYIPLYERYFSSFRGRKIRFLEIGVSHGGSLQMWRKYFGDDAIIFGIDIDAECEKYNGQAGQVRIGSQTDKNFLESVVKEMGGVDIVLDDGSHVMKHITTTLEYLFPSLTEVGVYMIEDLHTAY
jgi:23S rRNA U2552 (ribose-2'-O)-methylase RlmE/FtsJ